MCRRFLLFKFWRILQGISLENFSGHFSWQFPNLVVLNLVVCSFYAEALSCTLRRPFAPFCALAFALFCVHLRSFALAANDRIWESDRVWELQILPTKMRRKIRRQKPQKNFGGPKIGCTRRGSYSANGRVSAF